MTTFYLVRHGQTDWNAKRIVQTDEEASIISLSHLGKEQIKLLAKKLKNKDISVIFSSDSLRTKQTAEILSKELGIPIKIDTRLRERFMGAKYKGMIRDDLIKLYSEWDLLSHEERFAFHLEDEESHASGYKRLTDFMKEIALKYNNQTLVAATHSGLIRAFLIKELQGTFDTIGGVVNSGYVKVTFDKETFDIQEVFGVKSWEESFPKQ